MKKILKAFKLILNIFFTLAILIVIFEIFNPVQYADNNSKVPLIVEKVLPFSLSTTAIAYDNKPKVSTPTPKTNSSSNSNSAKDNIINRAISMAEVKWTPKYNLIDKEAHYTFIKGKTYTGIPYSMGGYQAVSPSDFLSKIKSSKTVMGNDCSGFVSAVWGLSRQTTLSFYNAVKNKSKIDGKSIYQISWSDLQPGDALLLDNGKGKGHVMIYNNTDSKDSDQIYVYEQNVPTIFPFQPIPVARKDARSVSNLKKAGYIPIRLNE